MFQSLINQMLKDEIKQNQLKKNVKNNMSQSTKSLTRVIRLI
jgi:hypothetical protein